MYLAERSSDPFDWVVLTAAFFTTVLILLSVPGAILREIRD